MANRRCERKRKHGKYGEPQGTELSFFVQCVALSRCAAATEHGYVGTMRLLPDCRRVTACDRAGWPEGNTIDEGESM